MVEELLVATREGRLEERPAHYSLPTTHYSLLTTYRSYLPLTTHSLPTRYSLLTTYHSLLTTHYSLPTTHYSLLTTHYSLLTTHYSLLTTHYSLLTTHYSQADPADPPLSVFCLTDGMDNLSPSVVGSLHSVTSAIGGIVGPQSGLPLYAPRSPLERVSAVRRRALASDSPGLVPTERVPVWLTWVALGEGGHQFSEAPLPSAITLVDATPCSLSPQWEPRGGSPCDHHGRRRRTAGSLHIRAAASGCSEHRAGGDCARCD